MRTPHDIPRHHRAAVLAPAIAALIGGVLLPAATVGATAASASTSTTQTGQSTTGSDSCPMANPPNELLLVAGTPQTVQLDSALSTEPQVALANTNGCPVSPVAGTPVSFTAPSSGASASFAESGSTALTVGADSSGNASAGTITANDTPGSYTVTATSAYGSVSFSFTNTAAGMPDTVTAISPTSQHAHADGRYKHRLSVRVLDSDGQPISGVTVTFTFGAGGSNAAGTTSNGSSSETDGSTGADGGAGATFPGGSSTVSTRTDSDGIVSSPRFVANQSAGPFTAYASVTQVSKQARFQLLNLPARGVRLARLGTRRRTAKVGRRYRKRLRVRLRSPSGRPVIGATVTFTLATSTNSANAQATSGSTSAGASFPGASTQATETTNANGIAVSPPLIANTAAGSFTATAATTTGGGSTIFQLVSRPGPAATITAGAAATEAAPAGARFPIPLAVTITDTYGNPVPSAPVRFTAPAAGASGSFDGRRTATVRSDKHGVAVAPPLTANRAPGGYIVTATTRHAPAAAFALANQAA
ncbi:MAG: hypothetical protein ACRDLT_11340 [Solirubrobacteraceae bacterium]